MVKVITEVFHKDVVYLIKRNVQIIKETQAYSVDTKTFNRKFVHNDPFFFEILQMLVPRVSEILGKEVKASYVFTSMYAGAGICPPHVDRPQCKYTLDYCISQKEPWDIYVNDVDDPKVTNPEILSANAKPYTLQENDALILSGTDNWHFRHKIKEDNFCELLFFHFVDKDFTGSLD